jgi:tRNA (guanine37-N1)-methyltransferase
VPEVACLKVQSDLAEKAIVAARRLGIFNMDLKVQQVREHVLIPLNADPSPQDLEELKKNVGEFEVSTSNFVSREKRPKTLIDVLEGKLPPHLIASLPKSLDIVGEVAVVEVPPELEGYKKLLGGAILTVHQNVRGVLAKASAISGPYRVRTFEVIAGVGGTETTHHEHGCAYRLDVAKVYFSPRLAYEHGRVSSQVKENEVVLDMFAGVGPFSILIAKKHRRIKVYSIDINPVAIQYLKQNIIINKVQNRVIPLQGDARKLVEEQLTGVVDRVIMNLPAEALAYVDVACKALKPEGGIIHYYEIAAEPDPLEKAKEKFSEAVSKAGRKIERFIAERMVKPTAPHEWQVAIDAIIR